MAGRGPVAPLVVAHEPTAKHLRERVEGPVVVWELVDVDEHARALAVADVLLTWLRPDVFTVLLAKEPLSAEPAEALRQFASDLNLIRAWIVPAPEPGQREAFAERAAVWLTGVPAGSLASIAEALESLLETRAVASA